MRLFAALSDEQENSGANDGQRAEGVDPPVRGDSDKDCGGAIGATDDADVRRGENILHVTASFQAHACQ